MTLLLQAVADGLQMGLLYALVAVGLTIIWGLMEMINFAHGEFMMLGMFGAWGLSVAMGWDPLVSMVPLAVAMYGAGVLVYRLLMRRVQRGEVFTQIFATVGLFFFLQNGVVALFTSDYRFVNKSLLTGLSGVNIALGGVRVGVPLLVGGLIALALFLILYLLIDRTDFGLALQATAEDRDAAMLVGIRPQRMYAVAWGLGTALVAVAGVILANFFAVYPQAGLSFTVLAYAIVALGGFGSILGTLLAALLVGVVQSVTAAYLPPAFKDAFVFASYILIGLFRPQGLFGRFSSAGARRPSRVGRVGGGRPRGPPLPDSLRAERLHLLRDGGLPRAAQRHARDRLEHHRRMGGSVRLRAQHLLRDRGVYCGAPVHPPRLERLARPARRGGRLGGHLRRAHLPGHPAPRPLLRDRHRSHVDDRPAHRRHLAVHQW